MRHIFSTHPTVIKKCSNVFDLEAGVANAKTQYFAD
jgi:hypothetical protein